MAKKKQAPKKTLVIVESPSKAKTIGKFLGSRYHVEASVGHVRDLPKSKLGIDIENDFEPQYITIRGKGDTIKTLKKEAKKSAKVYLATDPDREGEAISWHLAKILGIEQGHPCRIVFNEITKKTIKEAVKNPREIDERLVNAQQGRRILDRLVGYSISPLLWRKIRPGLSAGRVQSAALKIICDREKLIQDFVPEEYWTISALFQKKKKFEATLETYRGEKIKITTGDESDRVVKALEKGDFIVEGLTEKERHRRPSAPFTTSSLQQEASAKLNFNTKRTMRIAQQLYEGIDIKGKGTVGLITYIRTDSVRLADEARAAAKAYIEERFGSEYWSDNTYKNKKKDAQDAHEAIRPSDVLLNPEEIKESLSKEQYKLYHLIWARFVASQMAAASYFSVSAAIVNGDYGLKALGSKQKFDGFLKVYTLGKEEKNRLLPPLEQGEVLDSKEIKGEQNFTKPPARFTEATLVKDLEERDIGRPSTYAPIVGTLLERRYIAKEKKSLVPTELGFLVTKMMEEYFKEIVDAGFTAEMERQLDRVEVEQVAWKEIIQNFYQTFEEELRIADEKIPKIEVEDQITDEICEKCGKPMAIKQGRFGRFLACTGYPQCKNTKPIVKPIGVKCPLCGKDIIERKSKRGRIFYGCSGYPECENSYWDKPIARECPQCKEQGKTSLLVEKKGKETKWVCSDSQCDYKQSAEPEE